MESIGKTIRRLRKERNLTQETLAEQLNVTAQSISKWETEVGMPDISQIVPLANIFGVTTDELLGLRPGGAAASIAEVRKKAELPETTNDECIRLWEELLPVYPGNTTILSELAVVHLRRKEDGDYAEAARLYESVLDRSTDVTKRLKVLSMLCFSYNRAGDTKNAVRVAKLCGEAHISKDALLAKIDGYEKRNEVNQSLLTYCVEEAAWCILRQEYADDQTAIFALRKAISLLDTVYYDHNHAWISYVYIAIQAKLCRLLAKVGDTEALYPELGKWLKESVFEDRLPEGDNGYAGNVLLDKIIRHRNSTTPATWGLECIRQHTAAPEYDGVRDTERFKAFLKSAEEAYAAS